ncbi:DDB1- and CUL4-associated factor 8 [Cyphomyrmex costatus]|uniref:DDB1-and CUL4-associated factor 8 n=1 Tax=Cyphomyrmex costatus TaxID=456900 RepID=A0A195CMC6_9HYME|nr:DDB1- and CUL4-associated factor 8 [Cyphomyrmex costatus]
MISNNLETKKPPPNWFIVQEVINRQIGSNPLFQRRFYSSLHAVNRLEFKYKLHDIEDVSALSFNQNGNLLASAALNKVSIWDWAARKKRCCLPSGILTEAKWLPLDVENFMVTREDYGDIHLLDLEYNSRKQLLHYESSFHNLVPRRHLFMNDRSLAVHPEIPYVVFSAGKDSILSIDIREDPSKLVDMKKFRNSTLTSIHCNPSNSNEFCVSGHFSCVRVYDQRNISKPLYQLWTTKYGKYGRGTIAMYNHDGTEILTLFHASKILLFDKSMWSCEGTSNHTLFESNQFSILGINFFGPKSEFIISASDLGDIFIYDKEKRTAAQWLREDYKYVNHHCLGHPHIPILATASESSVLIWMPSRNEDRKKFRTVCIELSVRFFLHFFFSLNHIIY